MQEIIDRILEGKFKHENGSLLLSCTKIEINIPAGASYEGTFQIRSMSNQLTDGYIHTTDFRMECFTPTFSGCDEEISFCFHGEHLEAGEVVKGAFNIISNHGEYCLPFVVSVEHTVLESSIGTIKNLFHFANLAKSNWQEAVKLFYSPDFVRIFAGDDAGSYDTYRGLAAYLGNEQNMEEFLIRLHKKQAVEFRTEEKELYLELAAGEGTYRVIEQEIEIIRNGWGYTALNVECDGEFVFTEKEFLTDDDFLGNRCRLPIYIDSSLCRKGRNFGQIVLYNSYVCITIPITIRLGENMHVDLAQRRIIVQLMETYQAFRMKEISSAAWLQASGKLVERLVAFDENQVSARLFQAQLLISEKRYHEADWILDHAVSLMEENDMEEGTLWAYYLYLTTLINKEEKYVKRIAEEVQQIYRKNPNAWRVAWLLLYLSEEYTKSAAKKWLFLEKQFYRGCSSPVLYIEALYLLGNNPALLRRLDAYELQVLYYGARHQVLNWELVEQILYLAGRVREYSPILFGILVRLYEKKAEGRILQEICTQLIKGGKLGAKYFVWYQRGVEAQLRITNLYEYYMMSLDLTAQQKLPKILLMYFSYQNHLDYEHSAYLYQYILQHKAEYEDIYANYRLRIEYFVVEQIQKLHMNRHLATLYQELLTPGMITEENAGALSKLLFAQLIQVKDLRLRKVIVYHAGNRQADEYLLQDGQTWVALYGNNYTILFEDGWGNRFAESVDYTLEKLMTPEKLLGIIAHYTHTSLSLDRYLCETRPEEITQNGIERVLRVVAVECIDSEVKRELHLKIVQYYYDSDNMRALDDYLEQIPFGELRAEERSRVLKFMVLRGKYETAYRYLASFGPYFADSKTLVRLAGEMMRRSNMAEDAVLLEAAACVFRKGKYDSTILSYLTLYFEGLTKDMRDVWKAAEAFETDCYRLSEKMLVQMLYSGAFVEEKMDIFRYYVSKGAKQSVMSVFLCQCAHDYFVKDEPTEGYVFGQIKNAYLRNEEIGQVCKLAFLKYFAEHPSYLTSEESPIIEAFLKELLDKGVRLSFFRDLKEFRALTQVMRDKTIVEYRTKSGIRAQIHYVLVNENGEADEYITEYMTEVYGGVCFKEFILFFGENLQYYITEELDGEERLMENGNIQKNETASEHTSNRYDMINDMMISKTLQDCDALEELLEKYYRREYWSTQMFHLQ